MEFLINIDVDDLPRAIDFYQSAFGLRPGRSFGASGMEMLGGEVRDFEDEMQPAVWLRQNA